MQNPLDYITSKLEANVIKVEEACNYIEHANEHASEDGNNDYLDMIREEGDSSSDFLKDDASSQEGLDDNPFQLETKPD